jgi:Domain of unknown function (DUF4432)
MNAILSIGGSSYALFPAARGHLEAPRERNGVHVVRAGQLVVDVDEHRGGEITRVRYRDRDVLASYDWTAPVGTSRSATYGHPKLDWLSEYRGGWQLLVPNAGAACEVAGVPLPFHGEWSRTRVTVTGRDVQRVAMTAGTRLPLSVRREVRVTTDPDRVLVHTTVANECADNVAFIWGEHPAFSIGPGDEIDFPSADVYDADAVAIGRWPSATDGRNLGRLGPADEGDSLHFLVGFSEGWAAIRRRHLGVALAWQVNDFPYVWLWQEIGSPAFPFFGRASILAIEPAASWPGAGLAAAIERGQALVLGPDQRRSTTVALIPFEPSGRCVAGATIDGEVRFAS